MSDQTNTPVSKLLDEDAKFDFAQKKAKKKYRNQVRKYRREAENENGELNLTAMMDMMTILLVFLIKSYGAAEVSIAMGDDLTPPSSESTLMPIEGVTSVTITKKDISVAEKGIAKLVDGKVAPESLDESGLIAPVKAALEREVQKAAETSGRAKQLAAAAELAGVKSDVEPIQMLTVVGDKDLPYETLYYVLKTAGRIEVDESKGQKRLKFFKFLVLSNS